MDTFRDIGIAVICVVLSICCLAYVLTKLEHEKPRNIFYIEWGRK